MKLSTVLHRVIPTLSLLTVIAIPSVLTASPLQAETLNGAGSTFPTPLYERYAREIRKKYPDLTINYQAIGSGGGIRQVIAGTVDFGASDTAMADEEIAKVKNGVVLVPTAGGAVAVVYNLPGVNGLKLSRATLPAIFSGQITQWDDAKIKADNPGVNLPSQPIKFVVRADSSGTTYIFTNHLSSINGYFKGRIGTSKAPKWTLPNPLKGKGNAGLAGLVARTPGAIGYVEYSYAVANNLRSAEIQNKEGLFVSPTLVTTNQALSNVRFQTTFGSSLAIQLRAIRSWVLPGC